MVKTSILTLIFKDWGLITIVGIVGPRTVGGKWGVGSSESRKFNKEYEGKTNSSV